jgi:hypothetical protein
MRTTSSTGKETCVKEKKDRRQLLLSEVHVDTAMAASVKISSIESMAIDTVFEMKEPKPDRNSISIGALEDQQLYEKMEARSELGRFQSAIESTNVTSAKYLVDEDDTEAIESMTDDKQSITDKQALDSLFESAT